MRAASLGWPPASLVSFERFKVLPRMAFPVAPARVGLPLRVTRWPRYAWPCVQSSPSILAIAGFGFLATMKQAGAEISNSGLARKGQIPGLQGQSPRLRAH